MPDTFLQLMDLGQGRLLIKLMGRDVVGEDAWSIALCLSASHVPQLIDELGKLVDKNRVATEPEPEPARKPEPYVPLVCKFGLDGSTVSLKVVQQDERTRVAGTHTASNGLSVSVGLLPDIHHANSIFVRGSDRSEDTYTPKYQFGSQPEAITWLQRVVVAIDEFNAYYRAKIESTDG